jgi:MoxR-like ATPase
MSTSTAMIEFTCQSCGRLLRVPQSAAGRQVKCPQCAAVQPVNIPGGAPPAPAFGNSQPFGQATAPPQPMNDFFTSPPAAPLPTIGSTPVPAVSNPSAYPPGHASASVAPAAPLAPAPTHPESHSASAPSQPRQNYIGRDTATKRLFDRMTAEIGKLYVGQDELVLGALVALFSSGHVLIESVPGLGKTLFVRTLGSVLGCKFGRIQFTADLMPSDITGAPIFDMKQQEFKFRPGPVFTQFLLADEINRSPAKTHAALLEIMQEYRVTIDGVSHPLERPFLVLATQNPIESEGTYNLPEAQLDRFMFKLVAEYPQEKEEAEILRLHSQQVDINERLTKEVQTVTSPEEIMRITLENANIRVEDKLLAYINKIVRLTRGWPQFHMGASPRAGIALVQAARTLAAFYGRDYAVPDDVQQIALPALRHRVSLTAEAEVEGQNVDDLLRELIRSVEVPRL